MLLSDHAKVMRKDDRDAAAQLYQDAFNVFITIKTKTVDDYRKAADEAHGAANNYFNNEKYAQAVESYENGIKYLLSIEKLANELEDDDYRELIMLCIDMSDAYLHMDNCSLANTVFSKAVEAFKLIKHKTLVENNLLNKNDDYKALRNYIEKLTSQQSYLNSNHFQNNQTLLYNKRGYDSLLNRITSLHVDDAMQVDNTLHTQLNNMNVSSMQLFTPLSKQDHVSDNDYRNTAKELIFIGKKHALLNKKNDAIETLKQALKTYNRIRFKEPVDKVAINEIMQEITRLKEPQQPKPPQTKPFYFQPQANQTFWGQPPTNPSPPFDMDIETPNTSNQMDLG